MNNLVKKSKLKLEPLKQKVKYDTMYIDEEILIQ